MSCVLLEDDREDMTVLNNINFGPMSVVLSLATIELSNSRRLIDFTDISGARLSYGGGGLTGNVALGVNYSTDGGSTWAELVAAGAPLPLAGTILATTWTNVSHLQKNGDVMINVMAYGLALLTGLTYQITFADLQLR